MKDESNVPKVDPQIYPEKKDEADPIDIKQQKKYNDGIGGDAVASMFSSAFLLFIAIRTTVSLLGHKDMGGAGDVLIIAFPVMVVAVVLSNSFSSSAKRKIRQAPDGCNIQKSTSKLVKLASFSSGMSLIISFISIVVLFLSY